MQILKDLAEQHPLLEICENIKLESYTSQNFMGFFVNGEVANKLKRFAMQFVQKVSNSGIINFFFIIAVRLNFTMLLYYFELKNREQFEKCLLLLLDVYL